MVMRWKGWSGKEGYRRVEGRYNEDRKNKFDSLKGLRCRHLDKEKQRQTGIDRRKDRGE